MTPEEYLKDQCEKHGFRLVKQEPDVWLVLAFFRDGVIVPYTSRGTVDKKAAVAIVLSKELDNNANIKRVDSGFEILYGLCTAC